MSGEEIIPHLFRVEYQKMISVLSHLFGMQHIEIAEDIASDTFLAATESWAIKGVPEYPEAWLYTVAKNKAKNYFKHNSVFDKKIAPEIKYQFVDAKDEIKIDLSPKNIEDSQLAMIFTICDPSNSDEAQIALALNLLCGFGINEIADAFLTNKEVIYKRINRAKEKLKNEQVVIQYPSVTQIKERLENVLKIVYLMFSEGYYSTSNNMVLRKDFCLEAMRLNSLLIANSHCNLPQVNALMALMCFHVSRFEARLDVRGEIILYQDQNQSLWNVELIQRGGYFLSQAASGEKLSKYHLEAAIAYWHTRKEDFPKKWKNILELYDSLLILGPSRIVALNRCFVLSKIYGKKHAIAETEKLNLKGSHFYYSLLGNLYTDVDNKQALIHFKTAYALANTIADKNIISKNIAQLLL